MSARGMAELAALIQRGLEGLDLAFPPDSPARLAALALLLCRWGGQINLSGHQTPELIAENLILDAAALSVVLPPFESVAALGSGAGFPGLPLAILFPRVEVRLVEARRRRHHFQRAAVRALELRNAHPLLGRIEELSPEPGTIALAQAVGPAGAVLPAIRPWAVPGGWLAIPASMDSPRPETLPGAGAPAAVEYAVPGGRKRKVWLLAV